MVCTLGAQTFDWAVSFGSTADDRGWSIDADSSGNSYVTGMFSATMVIGTYTLTPAGGSDVYVVKYNNAGNVMWALSAGGSGNDEAYGISVDGAGHLAITGIYQNTATFGTATLSASSGYFAAMYDVNGNFQWAREFGSPNGGYAWDIDLDPAGHSNITGYFTGTETFGTTTLTSSGLNDGFVLQYDVNGNFDWAVKLGGTADDVPYAIRNDGAGNIYVTGRYAGTASFGSFTSSSAGGNDIFIAALNPTGMFQWIASSGSCPGDDSGQGIDVDASGNVTITGYIALGTAAFDTTYLTSNGMTDIFIARYNSAGVLQWAKNYGGSGDDYASDIRLSSSGAIFVTGYYTNTITVGASTLTAVGGHDALLMCADMTGNALYALSGGGAGTEYGRTVAASAGYVYVAGIFNANGVYAPFNLTSNGMNDIFVARIKDNEVGIPVYSSAAWNVYPVPAQSTLEIDLLGFTEGNSVKICDMHGRLVELYKLTSSHTSLDISALATGTYIVMLVEGENIIARRELIKE